MEERWFDEELSGCRLGDGRLDRRLYQLVERMDAGFRETIPLACQDRANTKAAYRFFSNERVSEEEILRGHFEATRLRFAATDGPILVLHDTTEFSWKRSRSEAVGFTTKVGGRKDKRGRPRMHTVCGLLMHSSLATTAEGLPLGMAAAKFWSRKKFKGTNALKRKINPTRVPIKVKESMRWLDNLRQSTDLPVENHADAVGKLHWYAMRWKIEVFHKILKSGCRAEQARLRTAERLVRLLAVFCILSWRVFWLRMLNRAKPDLEPELVLTGLETKILDRLLPDSTADPTSARTISLYLIKIARLGGYLARTKDPPTGNIVMWRGLSRLNDIALGATLQINDVGN